jgi:hypothetical protein
VLNKEDDLALAIAEGRGNRVVGMSHAALKGRTIHAEVGAEVLQNRLALVVAKDAVVRVLVGFCEKCWFFPKPNPKNSLSNARARVSLPTVASGAVVRVPTLRGRVVLPTVATGAVVRTPTLRYRVALPALPNAPTLAVLVTSGNALLARSRDIVDNVNGRVTMLRDSADGREVDMEKYKELARSLADATPAIDTLLSSPIVRPEIVDVIGRVGQAALEADRLTVHPLAHVEDVGEVIEIPAQRRGCRGQPRPGVAGAVHDSALSSRFGVVATPDEQPRQIKAMIGVQMGQQDVHLVGVGVALQRPEHAAAEVDDQWRGVGGGQQVARRRRIRPDDTSRAAQDGQSHSTKLATLRVGKLVLSLASE